MEELNNKRTLLVVDDEENILSSLTRLFRREGYKILRGNSGQEGLDILEENNVGVIISDQRMPEMTGVEFLSKVKLKHPDIIRIVLSGYTDLKSITDAINEGAIYKFLTKPWDDELIKKNVLEAFELHEMKLENKMLNEELKVAYESLEKVNKSLYQNVEIKTEEAELNLRVLTIAQEVLENMPAGIIGIADDGVIAITNKLTDQWISNGGASIVGISVEHGLPPVMFDLYKKYLKNSESQYELLTLPDSIQLEVRCSKLGKYSDSDGTILVLTEAK
ncbi:MAG: response regulator [Gammaproteobacteria bacterium]|nr:response regulator [Gammaproteobacteria bacterium]